MKPRVVHLIGDKLAGGSNLYVQRLISSCLSEKYDFAVFRLEEFKATPQTVKPDLIIFHYPSTWKYLFELIKLRKQSKVVIIEHHYTEGFELDRVPNRFRFRLMLKLAYGLANCVLCISQGQKQWMLKRKLVAPSKVRVITLSASGAARIEDLLNLPQKIPGIPLVLAAYGRFARQKGFDVLLQAMTDVSAENFLLYLGGYGFEEETIHQLAEGLPHVKLVGAVRDIPAFLAMCDVVVIPSRWESGGIVALEAKAAGKPVIASDIDGLPEQVQSCGLLVPPNDFKQLASAIASLPQHDLTSWGQTARNSVVNTWEQCLSNWENLLEEMI